MTEEEQKQIADLREQGYGYSRIADALGIKLNTVKAYCKRHGLGGKAAEVVEPTKVYRKCQCCGKRISSVEGRKAKKFCSDKCRNDWWNANLDKVNRKAHYQFVCCYCNTPFTAYGNKHRKYCSRDCYAADRKKKV